MPFVWMYDYVREAFQKKDPTRPGVDKVLGMF